ncbi:MAG: hypothetical protein PWQ06_874, partial [Anaerophaga sp.]|nr:hypothetical protein [Anaerophaga sp.]
MAGKVYLNGCLIHQINDRFIDNTAVKGKANLAGTTGAVAFP